MSFEKIDEVRGRLRARAMTVPPELHPILRLKVQQIITMLDDRVTPWEGYRGPEAQARAFAEGTSTKLFPESPHNHKPFAFACDLVLNPDKVKVRPNPTDPRWPNLWDSGIPREHPKGVWDDGAPEAFKTWEDLAKAAQIVGLRRVRFISGEWDLPHVELPSWERILKRPQ